MLFIDFEFRGVTEKHLDLVCNVTLDDAEGVPKKFWLHDDSGSQSVLKSYLLFNKHKTIVAYNAIAEARSFISMGLDPLEFKWIDLFLEYRCLTNHNDELGYGKQLVDGKVKYTERPKPKYLRTEEDVGNGFKPTHSLVEATYKLLGEIRNSEHKDKMRDIIINSPSFTDEERKAIIDYCEEDVVLLPSLFRKCREWYRKLLGYDSKTLLEEMELRGRYAAHTAIMESNGYPIDVEKTRNFSKSVDSILEDCQREINDLFPQIKPFKWNTLNQKFRWDQKLTRDWISKNHEVERWMKTDKGELSYP